jgi:hypothetical protein
MLIVLCPLELNTLSGNGVVETATKMGNESQHTMGF